MHQVFLEAIHHMGKQNAAALWVLWRLLFWFYAVKLCFSAPGSQGGSQVWEM